MTSGLVLLTLALAAGYRVLRPDGARTPPTSPAATSRGGSPASATESTAAVEAQPGFLFGRITTLTGGTYEGRLRWGSGREEAFWGDFFNGVKRGNSWVTHVPPERRPKDRRPLEIFGVEIMKRERPVELGRLFLARFGDIARLDADGVAGVRVTLKSGTVFHLDRNAASDFDDTVRVWDGNRGQVDLDSRKIRTIELLPVVALAPDPGRLHGIVHSQHGDFTGFLLWNREECVGADALDGRAEGRMVSLRFDTIRAIARTSGESCTVTLLDGRELVLGGSAEAGDGNRGIYVYDPRYGRVLIPWDAFENVQLSPGDSGPAYGDFPPGRPLTGSVTTNGGRRLTGRLVYDLDESETSETLDAPSQGLAYTIPFGLISAIVPQREPERVKVTLRSGEELQFERRGDVGKGNAGLLIFVDGKEPPEYVPWNDVERIDLD